MGFYGVSVRHLQRYTVVLAWHNEDSFWVTGRKLEECRPRALCAHKKSRLPERSGSPTEDNVIRLLL